MKNSTTKKVTFMMGAAGAGKSTIINKIRPNIPVIDADKFKEEHPQYDPNNPQALHQWSKGEVKKAFSMALCGEGSIIMDGTGKTSEKMIFNARKALEMGFDVEFIYVKVSLQTSIDRQQLRERKVPVEVIREQHALIPITAETLKVMGFNVIEINND